MRIKIDCFKYKDECEVLELKLHTLLSHLHLLVPFQGENPDITSIENDHRKVQKGSLFICIKGYTVDGHDFASAAVERGAAAVLAEKPLDLPVPVVVVDNTRRAMAVLADAFYGHPSQKFILSVLPARTEKQQLLI